jgi:hypothetical protein
MTNEPPFISVPVADATIALAFDACLVAAPVSRCPRTAPVPGTRRGRTRAGARRARGPTTGTWPRTVPHPTGGRNPPPGGACTAPSSRCPAPPAADAVPWPSTPTATPTTGPPRLTCEPDLERAGAVRRPRRSTTSRRSHSTPCPTVGGRGAAISSPRARGATWAPARGSPRRVVERGRVACPRRARGDASRPGSFDAPHGHCRSPTCLSPRGSQTPSMSLHRTTVRVA